MSSRLIVSSALSLYAWINGVSDILGSKVLLVCGKDGLRLQQTDHSQICLVDAHHVATLEGEGFNVCVDTKRLLTILRQATSDDVAKLCPKDEKIFEVQLHSPTRQATLDVGTRPLIKAMVMADLPKPTFELAIPVGVFKKFLVLTRPAGKLMGIAIAKEKKGDRRSPVYVVLFSEECRSLWRVKGETDKENEADEAEAGDKVIDVDPSSLLGFFRQVYHLGVVKTIFKGLAPEQRVVVKLHPEQPLQIILPAVGGRRTRFVVAAVIQQTETTAPQPPGSSPSEPGTDEDLPDLISTEDATK